MTKMISGNPVADGKNEIDRVARGGPSAAVGVLFFYYLLLVMGMNLADRETIPALPALWMANGVATIVGLILFRKRLAS